MHGDIPQKQREITLKGFRNGVFEVLIATNVAARGLDIPEVDLVIQCSPPKVSHLGETKIVIWFFCDRIVGYFSVSPELCSDSQMKWIFCKCWPRIS